MKPKGAGGLAAPFPPPPPPLLLLLLLLLLHLRGEGGLHLPPEGRERRAHRGRHRRHRARVGHARGAREGRGEPHGHPHGVGPRRNRGRCGPVDVGVCLGALLRGPHRFPVDLVLRPPVFARELFVVFFRGVVGRNALLVVVIGPAPRARAPVGLRAGGLLRLERLERRVRQGLRHVRLVAVLFRDRPLVGAELVLLVTVRGDLGLPVAPRPVVPVAPRPRPPVRAHD